MSERSERTAVAGTGLDLAAVRARLAAAPDADRLQPLGLGQVVSGPGALAALPAVLGDLLGSASPGQVAVLADATAIRRGADCGGPGGDLKAAVRELLAAAGHRVRAVTAGPPDGHAHADEATLAAVRDAVAGAAAVVSVGSGTLTDIGKAVAAELGGLPHVVVQTAASVNGYADDQAVLLRHGVKRTVPARWPDALLIDPDVLAAAPPAMTRAGLGDLVSMFTATADWYLAAAVGMDTSYSPTAVALGRGLGEEVLALAPALGAQDPPAVARLAEVLALSGISMGVAGRTAPSSGMEHTVSHLLEMDATRRGRPAALHGAQVGVATVVAAVAWRLVRDRIATAGVTPRFPTEDEMERRVRAAFGGLDPGGAMARECWADYRRKLARWHARRDALERLDATWAVHEQALDRLLVEPARLVAALRAAGAPVRFAELGVEPDTARWAVAHCHLMRDRFTVADLAWFLGVWDGAGVAAVLEAAAALGAGL